VRKLIPFNRPFIVGRELYNISQAVIQNTQLAGNGAFTKLCQQWLQEHLGVKKVLLTNSGTAALEMSALLLNIQPGDEVIMPSFTFVSTANAFVLRGAVPVFIDIRPDTLNLDETLIPAALTSRTKAIVPVHYAGVSCNMDAIMKIAADNSLKVVEDAAHSLLSMEDGGRSHLGGIGHMGCLSFHETKNVISGEGGALLLNDPAYFERADILWEKGTNRSQFFEGRVDKYTWVDVGSSFLPGELTAAFLYAQLENAYRINAMRTRICRLYAEQLADLAAEYGLRLSVNDDSSSSNGHMFYIITRSGEERKALQAYLTEQRIVSTFHYIPLHSSPAGRKFGRYSGSLQVTDDTSARLLRLPLYYELTTDDISYVCETIKSFYAAGAQG
jgi:dTDP-4-amino-4,6-dideoxygalactose transaminase